MKIKPIIAGCVFFLAFTFAEGKAQTKIPPYDIWTDQVKAAIRDHSTLNMQIVPHIGYADVFFTSNPSADWYDSSPPYSVHTGEKITIHAFMAAPPLGGPYPALVLGHGHGGHADSNLTMGVAALGFVAFYIDGPQAGQSTGGPHDDNQAWISVDSGPQYGYLYHYAYAGMRALTALEEIAALPGNPYHIDTQKFGVLGASMGGIFTTYINGIDSRVKAAVILASAGNWQHTLRYPNSWLYHGIYVGTRNQPYNGSDPLNSISNIDTDPTTITFIDYFDTIRYAPRQYAPVLTVIGTHDQYFPLPNANLMEQAITSAGAEPNFEKRLWFLPNAPHQFDTSSLSLISVTAGVQQWLEYCFGNRSKPLASPQVALSADNAGLHFSITIAESQARLSGAVVTLYAATRVDSSEATINDFKAYLAVPQGNGFVAQIPAGEKSPSGDLITANNVIYYATATDSQLLPVSSLMYRASLPLDLSSDFIPTIGQFPGDSVVAPVPPPYTDTAVTATSSLPVPADPAYQGMALTNATEDPIAVRIEARNTEGRLAAGEGLINPVFIGLPPHSQQVFLAEQWLGLGARQFTGSFQAGWSSPRTDSLAFRGNVAPSQLEGIGPLAATSGPLWLPLAPEQDPGAQRLLRVFSTSSTAATVTVAFRNRSGTNLRSLQVSLPAWGTADLPVSAGIGDQENASAEFQSSSPIAARLEVSGAKDPWSIDAQPAPTATKLDQPHVEWNGIFTTRLLMLNTASSVQKIILRLHMVSGAPAALDVAQFLYPGQAASLTVESLFEASLGPGRGAGWLEVEAPNGQVVFIALAADSIGGAAASSPLLSSDTSSWSLPFYVENSGYWTGLALTNAGDAACSLTLTAYSPGGNMLATFTGTLDPQQSITQLVYQWMPELANGSTGYILISSSAPVSPLAYFGTSDGASLAAIPFTAISP